MLNVLVDRYISQEEFEELVKLMEATCYNDIRPDQFVITKNKVYFIDTESDPFGDNPNYYQMASLISMVDPVNRDFCMEYIKNKQQNHVENYDSPNKYKKYLLDFGFKHRNQPFYIDV